MKVSTRRHFVKKLAAAAALPLFMPHIARGATRKIRLGHNNSPTSGLQVAAVAMQKCIAEKSDGRLLVDIYPSAQLGNDMTIIKAVAEGTVECTICGGGPIASLATDIGLLELPFLFNDLANARKAFDAKIFEYTAEKLKGTGALYIGAGENGFRHITANKPIRKPEDMAGLKIRVQPTKLQLAVFKGIGAAAEAMNFSEMAEAMRIGRIEAQENPIGIVVSDDWIPKLQSHMSLTGHIYSQLGILFSSDVMDDLSEADRTIIRDGGAAGAKASRDFADKASETGLEKLKALGMTIISDVDKPAFQKAVGRLRDELTTVADADALAEIRKLVS